ncbi:MAG TPA: integrase arm-type DNA-binding domain-containing protein [Pseudolabrys sp.]|jgi:integrase
MARTVEKLSALRVAKETKPGLYSDGVGLYLRVTKSGAKSWAFRYMLDRRSREMGLGATHAVGLAEARQKAADARSLCARGVDPLTSKNAAEAEKRLKQAIEITFKDCADKYIAAHEKSWRNEKHRAQWRATLATYTYPIIGELPVALVDTALVTKIIEPLWSTKTETASRLRGRIETVLNWAKARGYREGDNPARWRGHLDNLLPAQSKVAKVEHHAALSYEELSAFMADLQVQDGVAARALEFTILTAARTSETIGAKWTEIDLEQGVWTVPAARMKAGREHRVPLSASALRVLEAMWAGYDDCFVFAGGKSDCPLSNMAMLSVLRRMKRDNLTVHGFRSTFRDWVAERTNFPSEVAEMALAHAVGNKVEAAYRRGDLFDRRRRIMAEWAKFCSTPRVVGQRKIIPFDRT